MPHPFAATRPSPHGHVPAIKGGYRGSDRPSVESAGFSWGGRAKQEGVVGPFTCERCLWSGTFWLFTLGAQRRRFFGRRGPGHVLVCRNCAHVSEVPPTAAPALVASAGPVLVADPLGPEPEPVATDTPPRGA